jgi:hypothetical protein
MFTIKESSTAKRCSRPVRSACHAHAHALDRGEASERARVAHLSPLFNFTGGVPKGYLITWMGDSSDTHKVFFSFP